MAAEQAQHLIAMSLGKIAASRNQRGGANLHRSLLVSTVLHKARTTIMMENFQAMMQQRRAQMEAQQRAEFGHEERPATPMPAAVPPREDRRDKENCPPGAPRHGDRLSDVKEHDSNNNSYTPTPSNTSPSPLQQSNADNTSSNTTPRCAKRRVCDLGPCDSDFNGAKRTKFESDSELSHHVSSRSDCAFENEDYSSDSNNSSAVEQPMQADPVQITNLVQRFNSGLSGLLTQVANEQQQHQQQCSEQAFTSCCTQVVKDSGMESLSRPCIALTV